MGGFGSGRQGGKSVTAEMWALDIREVSRAGGLALGPWFKWNWTRNGETVATISVYPDTDWVTVNYQARERSGDWQQMEYPVVLIRTPCHLGGARSWWLCPAVGCGRRVAVLYGGLVFACRHCHKLEYRSQRQQRHDRLRNRASKIRQFLGWEAGILNGYGGKPKWMHWATFERLVDGHDDFVNQSLAGVLNKFGRLPDMTSA